MGRDGWKVRFATSRREKTRKLGGTHNDVLYLHNDKSAMFYEDVRLSLIESVSFRLPADAYLGCCFANIPIHKFEE